MLVLGTKCLGVDALCLEPAARLGLNIRALGLSRSLQMTSPCFTCLRENWLLTRLDIVGRLYV